MEKIAHHDETPSREPALQRWPRRAVTLPGYLLCFLLVAASLPVAAGTAFVIDLIRGRGLILARIVVFFAWYLACEVAGVAAAFALWVAYRLRPDVSREEFLDWNFRLQCFWARALGRGAFAIFSITVRIEGEEALSRRPLVLFIRHASVADTVLAAMFVADAHDIRLRYVLKRELLWDPCLDIVGNRLPNYFVRRDAVDTVAEVNAVANLANGLKEGEGVIMYPEGTRFSRKKRRRTIRRFRERGDELRAARAAELKHVLLPRPSGSLALMENAEGKELVFCAHTGFEGSRSFWDLWNGGLVNRVVRISFWKAPGKEIPADRESREAWLFEQWKTVDAFIDEFTDRERNQ